MAQARPQRLPPQASGRAWKLDQVMTTLSKQDPGHWFWLGRF
jgi:hypothetical protein